MKRFYRVLLSIGIALGVFCSIMVFSAGQREWTAIQLQNKALKSDLYKIVNAPDTTSIHGMGLEYVRQIQKLLPNGVLSDIKAQGINFHVSYDGEPLPVQNILGTESNLAVLLNMQLVWGRYISKEDMDRYRKVCVLKSYIYDMVKAGGDAHIDINGDSYEIIGVVSENGDSDFIDVEGEIFVPVTTFYQDIEKTDERSGLINQIIFKKGIGCKYPKYRHAGNRGDIPMHS